MNKKVFVELMRRGYIPGQTLFYYHTRNEKEVDFVTRKGAGEGGGIVAGNFGVWRIFCNFAAEKKKRL